MYLYDHEKRTKLIKYLTIFYFYLVFINFKDLNLTRGL